MSDLIKREDAIKATWKEPSYTDPYNVLTEVRDRINALPTASPWHRVTEPPKKTGKYAVCWTYQNKIYWDWLIFIDGDWKLQSGLPLPDYWMPIEPPQEDA